MRVDIHGYERQLEAALRRIKKSNLSEKNKLAIVKFQEDCFANGLSIPRVLHYMSRLQKIALWLGKDFKDAAKDDIIHLVEKIERMDYSEYTKHGFKVALKKFYKWLRKSEHYPKEVRWIKSTVRNEKSRLPEELLTEEEVKKLIEVAEHPRDKAFVFVLYESGCRVGELTTLRIKDVVFDRYGAQIIVSGKTGMRRIRLIASAPRLASWVDNHPERDNPNAPIWIGIGTRNKDKIVNYDCIRALLKRLAKRAGIKKRVNPHTFRHSRATHLSTHLKEAQMNQFFGWVQGSRMPSIYVHLSGRDVDKALLKMYGMAEEAEEKEKTPLKPKKCLRCDMVNPATAKLCNRCGMALDLETAMQIHEKRQLPDEFLTELVRHPEVQQFLLAMAKKFGLEKRLEEPV